MLCHEEKQLIYQSYHGVQFYSEYLGGGGVTYHSWPTLLYKNTSSVPWNDRIRIHIKSDRRLQKWNYGSLKWFFSLQFLVNSLFFVCKYLQLQNLLMGSWRLPHCRSKFLHIISPFLNYQLIVPRLQCHFIYILIGL